MPAILDTIATLRRAADVLESLNRDRPLDVYVGDVYVSIQVPRTFGDQAARIREVVRINNALGLTDRDYAVVGSDTRVFGIKDGHRTVSAYTALDEIDDTASEATRLLATAGAV